MTSEAAVIASLIHNPNLIYHSEELIAEHFSDIANRGIYKAIKYLVDKGIDRIDPPNIIEALSSSGEYEKYKDILTIEKVQELVEMSEVLTRGTPEEYSMFAKKVMDMAFRRDMLAALKYCIKVCGEEEKPPDKEEMQSEIYKTIDETISAYSMSDDIPEYSEVIDEMWEKIKERQRDGYAGVPFKFPALNDYVTAERGELIIFGAQQKVGKSIMLLNIAVDFLRKGLSVLYIDSELSTRLFTARLLSHLSGINYRNITSGQYTPEEEQIINEKREWMKTRKFTHIYMPFFDKETIYSTTKRVDHRQHIDVIIIDYFKSTGDSTDAYATYAEMGRIVDLVKNTLAGDMNIMAIGAAQATINNKLADSAKIARNASTIIMLVDKTPDEIENDGAECGNKKMIVTVNRNGAQMVSGEYIDMKFDGDKILYEQAPKQHTIIQPF